MPGRGRYAAADVGREDVRHVAWNLATPGVDAARLSEGVHLHDFAEVDGVRSYASGYPDAQELFLASSVPVDPATGEFEFDADGRIALTGGGLLVRWEEVEYLEFIDVDLLRVVEDTLASMAESAQSKGVELVAEIDHDLPATVLGPPVRLRQVLTNLIANAIKFTEKGSVVVRVSAEVASGVAAVHVEVEDTGIGIPSGDHARLFKAFSQADGSTFRKVQIDAS